MPPFIVGARVEGSPTVVGYTREEDSMRDVLYDKSPRSILHTHQAFKLGNDEP